MSNPKSDAKFDELCKLKYEEQAIVCGAIGM